MSSDTDSSSSSSSSNSSIDYKKRKSSKKQKHKKEKKLKKQKKKKHHKEKKRAKLEVKEITGVSSPIKNEANAFGPALPPHLQQKQSNFTESSAIIGPIIPAGCLNAAVTETAKHLIQERTEENHDSDNDMSFGPLPIDKNVMTLTEIEREQRALELKIAVMEGRDLNNKSDRKSREEWMLELPDVGLRGGLASLSNMKRTFYAGKEKPDFSDRSAWTKTPQSDDTSNQLPTSSKTNAESMRNQAEAKYARERDAEQEHLAKKHKKKHKRDESLMELHQKKLKKEKRQKEKELAEKGEKPERRPFSRDVDLKLNKIDSNQTKQIVNKAKILNSKFSCGKTKYL